MIDPNKVSGRKRSSLKSKQIFPDNMTLEDFLALQKNKNIKWDNQVVEHDIEKSPMNKNYNEAKARFQDPVLFTLIIL